MEHFSFSRVIYDEFSYSNLTKYNYLFFKHVNAPFKWILSGTLPFDTLFNVSKIGEMFGIHVASPEPRMPPGLPVITTGPTIAPLSSSEAFRQLLGPLRSVDLAIDRHRQGELFIQHFVRKNPANYPNIRIKTHLVSSGLDHARRLRYNLAFMELADAGHDYFGLDSTTRNQLMRRPAGNETGQILGKELLVSLASCPRFESTDSVERYLTGKHESKHRALAYLADKAMWLRDWLEKMNGIPIEKWSDPDRLAAERLDNWFKSYRRPVDGTGYYDRGGRAAYDAQLAALRLDDTASEEICPAKYLRDRSVTTWVDYYTLEQARNDEPPAPEEGARRKGKQPDRGGVNEGIDVQGNFKNCDIRLLFSLIQNVESLHNRSTGSRKRKRAHDDQAEIFDPDKSLATQLTMPAEDSDRLTRGACELVLQEWIEQARRLHEERKSVMAETIEDSSLEQLQDECLRFNIKFAAGDKVDAMRQKMLRHCDGDLAKTDYRDGRLVFNRVRDLPLTTADATRELNETLVDIDRTTTDLGVATRELQLWNSMKASRDDRSSHRCLCIGCGSKGRYILATCGHLVCDSCLVTTQATGLCVDATCRSFVQGRPILKLPLLNENYGKIRCLMDQISEIPVKEYILVFVQYEAMGKAVTKALAEKYGEQGFSSLLSGTQKDPSSVLEQFKAGMGGQVLLMNIDSESSAGSNLTVANHVMFVTPYINPNERSRRATIAQAKGRCVREGQEKDVHVYYLMTKDTIEERELQTMADWDDSLQEVLRAYYRSGAHLPWWHEDWNRDASWLMDVDLFVD